MKPCHFVATGYIVRDGKTLLVKHKKLHRWLPPGGHIEEGENPDVALRRELLEETGLQVDILPPKRIPNPRNGRVQYLHTPSHVQYETIDGHPSHIDLIYFCAAKSGKETLSSTEHDAQKWYSVQDLQGREISEEVRVTATLAITTVTAYLQESLL